MEANRFLSKRAILVLSLLSIVLFAVGFFLVSISVQCTYNNATTSQQYNCGASGVGGSTPGATIGSIILFVAFFLGLASWILGLIKAGRVRAWGWFIIVFLLPPVGSLLYGIFGRERPPDNVPTYVEGTPRAPVV